MASVLLQPVMPNLGRARGCSENLRDIWKVFSKVKDSMEGGRRLENLSWRLWFKSSTNKQDLSQLSEYMQKIEWSADGKTDLSRRPLHSTGSLPSVSSAAAATTEESGKASSCSAILTSKLNAMETSLSELSANLSTAQQTLTIKSSSSTALPAQPQLTSSWSKEVGFNPAAKATTVTVTDAPSPQRLQPRSRMTSSTKKPTFFIAESCSSEEDLSETSLSTIPCSSDASSDFFTSTMLPRTTNPAGFHSGFTSSTTHVAAPSQPMMRSTGPVFEKIAPSQQSSQHSALSSLLEQKPKSGLGRAIPQSHRRATSTLLEGTESLRLGLALDHQPLFRMRLGNDRDSPLNEMRQLPAAW